MALFGSSREWEYQVDTARNGAGRLVDHENRQGCCLSQASGAWPGISWFLVICYRVPSFSILQARRGLREADRVGYGVV